MLVHNISYETLMGAKPSHISFNKIRVYDGTTYLVLFRGEKYDFIYNRIRYLIGVKVVLSMSLLITMQKAKLIYTILYL